MPVSKLTIHDENTDREHLWENCWCDPVVERFNEKTNRWEEV